jgi:hypothetical protein
LFLLIQLYYNFILKIMILLWFECSFIKVLVLKFNSQWLLESGFKNCLGSGGCSTVNEIRAYKRSFTQLFGSLAHLLAVM